MVLSTIGEFINSHHTLCIYGYRTHMIWFAFFQRHLRSMYNIICQAYYITHLLFAVN